MKKKGEKIILFLLIMILISFNYNRINGFFINTFDSKEIVNVDRVIDGDTVVINGISVRLLGINTPEKGEYLYEEAKAFTAGKVMNKTVYIERNGKDRYDRELAYLYDSSGENINEKIVKEGYANYYFPEGKDRYYGKFALAWDKCLNSEKNLCEKSYDECAECISIEEFGYNKDAVLRNICSYDCDLNGWKVKDEGRKTYVYNSVLASGESSVITPEDFGVEYVWTKTGDTIFVRDDKGKLVAWEGY